MLGLTAHGGNRVLVGLANSVVAAGHGCCVLTPRCPASMPYRFDPRVKVRRIGPEVSNKFLRWALFACCLAIALRDRDVVANHFVTAMAARVAQLTSSARVVYLIQDIEYRFYEGGRRYLARWICEWTYRLPMLLPANAYLEGELLRHGLRPLAPLNLGVDRAFLEQPPIVGNRQFDVVYFLRRDRHKRLDRFLLIAQRLKQSRVTVAGISQDAGLLSECAALLSAAVSPAADSALIEVLDRARIMLLTSDQEGFSLPALEAMARGLPTVMFPCGGPSSYAKDGYNCVIVADESVDTAVAEIHRLLQDDRHYSRLSLNARTTAARFDFERALGEFIPRLAGMFAGSPLHRSQE